MANIIDGIRRVFRPSAAEYASKLGEKSQTLDGKEMPSDVPMAPPIGYQRQPSMVEHIRALVARELSQQAEAAGFESFEESDDFDVPDDVEPSSNYEMADDYEPVRSFRARKEVEEKEAAAIAAKEAEEGQGRPKAVAEGEEPLDAPEPIQARSGAAPRAARPKPS